MNSLSHDQVEIINYCLENHDFPKEVNQSDIDALININVLMKNKETYALNFDRSIFTPYYESHPNLRRIDYVLVKTIKTPIDIVSLHKRITDIKAENVDIFGVLECRSDVDGIKVYKLEVENFSEFKQRYDKYENSEARRVEIEKKRRYEEYLRLKAEFDQ